MEFKRTQDSNFNSLISQQAKYKKKRKEGGRKERRRYMLSIFRVPL